MDIEVKLAATKHASLTLADRYARVSLLAAERAVLEDDGPYGIIKARETLASAVRFGLRSHELAGGFDAQSREALEDVRAFLASIDERGRRIDTLVRLGTRRVGRSCGPKGARSQT